MACFQLSEIARMLGQDVKRDFEISGFKQDNREVQVGDMFFALKGEKIDGHVFLEDVAKRGGLAAMVSTEYSGDAYGLHLFKVEDVLASLQMLATKVHAMRNMRVVGVTGSVGKTTTKEFIATLLEGRFSVAKTPGNANSQVSVPLGILNIDDQKEVFVIEMGMSQKGELERLVQIAPPEISVLTNVSLAHVIFFPDGIEGIARAKAEIFSSDKTKLGIVSAQAAQFPDVLQTGRCPKVIYGAGAFQIKRGEVVTIIENGIESPPISLPFDASHLCENFLAAACVARAMGMQWEEIIFQTSKLATLPKRFEKIVRNGIIFVNDSYNANATSMKAALHNLPQGKKTIAVLGAMRELGEYTEQCHREVAEVALNYVDHLICLGKECQTMVDLFQTAKRPAVLCQDISEVRKKMQELTEEGDVVLIKGSRSNQLWLVLEDSSS